MAYNVHEKWSPEQITKYYSHITVSRDDVEKYEVVDFPIETRFFKLPVDGFLDVEGLFPRPAQIPVINALNDPKYRFIVAPLARRSGKSFISFNLAFLKSMEPNSKILLVAPNYSLANIGWTQINELTDKYQIDTSKRNSKDKEIFYENGSMIKIASISQISSAVGRSYDLVIWDEYALHENNDEARDAFMVAIRPCLDKPNSKCIFISTPRGRTFYYELYMRGFSDEFPSWCSIHSECYANPDMSEEDIAEAKKANSPESFKQEYEASFEVASGTVFTSFNDDNIRDLSEMEFQHKRFETIYGLDPGYKDPNAFCVIKYDMQDDVFYIVDGFLEGGITTNVLAEKILSMDKLWGPMDYMVVDSASAQLRQDLAVNFDLPSVASKKDQLANAENMHTLIHQKKLIVDSSLSDIILAIQNYSWKTDNSITGNRPKFVHDIHSHYVDSLKYALFLVSR